MSDHLSPEERKALRFVAIVYTIGIIGLFVLV